MFVWVLENTLEKYFQCLVMRVKAFSRKYFLAFGSPITKNIKIYTSKFYITIIEVPTYKN